MWQVVHDLQKSMTETQQANMLAMQQLMEATANTAKMTSALATQLAAIQCGSLSPTLPLPAEAPGGSCTGAQTNASAQGAAGVKGLVDLAKCGAPEPEEKIRPEITKHLQACAKKFEKNLLKWKKATERHKQDQKAMELFRTENEHRYPPGSRPFRSPAECSGLDERFPESVDGDYVIGVKITKGATRREAMQQMHHKTAMFLRQQISDANAEYMKSLAQASTKEAFFEAINSWVPDEGLPDLGLEKIEVNALNPTLVTKEAIRMYAETVKKIQKITAEEIKAKEEKEKEENEALEASKAERPEDLLNEIIDRRVTAKLNATGEVKTEAEVPMVDEDDDDKANATKFCEAMKAGTKEKDDAKKKKGDEVMKGKGKKDKDKKNPPGKSASKGKSNKGGDPKTGKGKSNIQSTGKGPKNVWFSKNVWSPSAGVGQNAKNNHGKKEGWNPKSYWNPKGGWQKSGWKKGQDGKGKGAMSKGKKGKGGKQSAWKGKDNGKGK